MRCFSVTFSRCCSRPAISAEFAGAHFIHSHHRQAGADESPNFSSRPPLTHPPFVRRIACECRLLGFFRFSGRRIVRNCCRMRIVGHLCRGRPRLVAYTPTCGGRACFWAARQGGVVQRRDYNGLRYDPISGRHSEGSRLDLLRWVRGDTTSITIRLCAAGRGLSFQAVMIPAGFRAQCQPFPAAACCAVLVKFPVLASRLVSASSALGVLRSRIRSWPAPKLVAVYLRCGCARARLCCSFPPSGCPCGKKKKTRPVDPTARLAMPRSSVQLRSPAVHQTERDGQGLKSFGTKGLHLPTFYCRIRRVR